MTGTLLASRLAERSRLPVVAAGALSAAISVANLFSLTPDGATTFGAVVVAAPGAGLFLCGVFDPRFHNALSALNAERRKHARAAGWMARLFGWRLPVADRPLLAIALVLLPVALIAADGFHKLSAAALAFAGFWLVGMTQIALMARGYPDDRFVPYF